MTDNPDAQEQIEEAAQGPAHEFHGTRLQPFSFDRNACWDRLGYGKLESTFEAFCAVVFLCTLSTAADWDAMDACRGPEKTRAMRQRFGQWCDLNKINGNSKEGVECMNLGFKIWQEMENSRFTIERTNGAEGPNA